MRTHRPCFYLSLAFAAGIGLGHCGISSWPLWSILSGIFIIASFFLPIEISHLPFTLLVVLLVSAVFSLAGFTNAMLARNFDDVMLVPTFVLTPLTYLGGVFYSISMLPPFWQKISYLNPILYMVNALRHAMICQEEVNMTLAMGIIILMIVGLTLLNMVMLKKGIGLRE